MPKILPLAGNPAADGDGLAYDAESDQWVAKAATKFGHHVDDQKGATDKDKLHAAFAAGTVDGAPVILPARTIDVGTGFSLAGYSCGMIGQGAGYTNELTGVMTAPHGSGIIASTQSGPVLDFTGYVYPYWMTAKVEFGNFSVVGSGVADPTGANSGVYIHPEDVGYGLHMHDITVRLTGGIGFDEGTVYLSDFERIVVMPPVGAVTNDVPYWRNKGSNGNRYIGVGFRGLTAGPNVGASGALVIEEGGEGGAWTSDRAEWIGTWFEYTNVPAGGRLIDVTANANRFTGTYFVDCGSGGGDSWYARFNTPTHQNIGGNEWIGLVPGNQNPALPTWAGGIDMRQSRNSVHGVKMWDGKNVVLRSGVQYNSIHLSGAWGEADGAAVVDDSGNDTNIYSDDMLDRRKHRGYTFAPGYEGPTIEKNGAPTTGAVNLGNSGVKIAGHSFDGGTMHLDADVVATRSKAGAQQFVFRNNISKGLTYPNVGTLPSAQASLRGQVTYRHGAAGVADQLFVCRKKADDSYEWVQLTT